MKRLVVVGGGIAGLAGARAARIAARAAGLSLEITLLEASSRFGGKILTETVDGVPLEWGPDSFLAEKPRGKDLAEELGLEVVPPGPAARRYFLYLKGRLRPYPAGLVMGIPTGLAPLVRAVTGGLVGPGAALRAAAEPLLPRVRGDDPSVGEVIRKRLGRGVADRLAAPLTTSVLGADPDQLSMAAVMPRLAAKRSLVLAMARAPRRRDGAAVFYTIRGGMGRLPERLIEELGGEDLRLGAPAKEIARDGDAWRVAADGEELRADAVLVAAPAFAAAPALTAALPEVASALEQAQYRSSAVLFLRFAAGAIGHPMDGSGYLVAPEERRAIAAVSWLPSKWPHIGSTDVWMRAVATDPRALALSDDELRERAAGEIAEACEAEAAPQDVRIMRWDRSLPIYVRGHRARMDAARATLPPGIALAGAAYDGFGVPDCIRTGEDAARALVANLRGL